MTLTPRLLLALALGFAGASAAGAQDRRHAAGANGPIVLEESLDVRRVPAPTRPDLRVVRAVPVPSVMNGGAFGPTGNNYYNDAFTEGPFGARRRVNEYVLSPALRAPLPGR